MSNTRKVDKRKLPKGVRNARVTQIDKGTGQRLILGYEHGLYFWRLPSGHLFTNEDGEALNIPARKGDQEKIDELRKAAAHYGQPEGTPWFQAGVGRATDEELEEQIDRLKSGDILLNDLGAVYDAQQTLKTFGAE